MSGVVCVKRTVQLLPYHPCVCVCVCVCVVCQTMNVQVHILQP